MPGRAWNAPLVGRTAELATLDEAMNAAADGTPAVVLIAGEAGIGKSRLTAEATRRAMADGWHVLTGGCLDLTEAPVRPKSPRACPPVRRPAVASMPRT